jgi:hypothetical protein
MRHTTQAQRFTRPRTERMARPRSTGPRIRSRICRMSPQRVSRGWGSRFSPMMVRIVSRSRRGARGAGYGWLLVTCGTAASVAGNVAHAPAGLGRPRHRRRHPPGRPGDAGGAQGGRPRGRPARHPAPVRPDRPARHPGPVRPGPPSRPGRPAGPPRPVRRPGAGRRDHRPACGSPRHPGGQHGRPRGPAAARPDPASDPRPDGRVRERLSAVHAHGRPDGQPWTARTLAEVAGCAKSTAAAFLAAHRQQQAQEEGGSR